MVSIHGVIWVPTFKMNGTPLTTECVYLSKNVKKSSENVPCMRCCSF